MRDPSQIDNVFMYHPDTEVQTRSYERIRAAAKQLASVIFDECPSCADRTDALRKVREAVMTANASIALDGVV